MQEFITLSSKGQVVIPKSIRNKAQIESGDRLMIEWNGEYMELRKVTKKESLPSASLVKELLGKYHVDTADADGDETETRKFRENLYGKIND